MQAENRNGYWAIYIAVNMVRIACYFIIYVVGAGICARRNGITPIARLTKTVLHRTTGRRAGSYQRLCRTVINQSANRLRCGASSIRIDDDIRSSHRERIGIRRTSQCTGGSSKELCAGERKTDLIACSSIEGTAVFDTRTTTGYTADVVDIRCTCKGYGHIFTGGDGMHLLSLMIPTKHLRIVCIGDVITTTVVAAVTSDGSTPFGTHGRCELYRVEKTVGNDRLWVIGLAPTYQATAVDGVVSSVKFAVEYTTFNPRTIGNTDQTAMRTIAALAGSEYDGRAAVENRTLFKGFSHDTTGKTSTGIDRSCDMQVLNGCTRNQGERSCIIGIGVNRQRHGVTCTVVGAAEPAVAGSYRSCHAADIGGLANNLTCVVIPSIATCNKDIPIIQRRNEIRVFLRSLTG